tara:strand:+ start:522 stop:758 length:237 start_codon:yes stop_codon:yes gene_type:complete
MGHMKNISQMIQDGSFDNEFVPAYERALNEGKQTYIYRGSKYSVDYADNVIELVLSFRNNKTDNDANNDAIELIKKFE